MTDFHQEGLITTIHALYEAFDREEYLENLERKLEEYARHRRIGLLLPSLYSEIQNPQVLDRIIEEIRKTRYIHSVVIALGGAPEETQFHEAREYFEKLTLVLDKPDPPIHPSMITNYDEMGIDRKKGQYRCLVGRECNSVPHFTFLVAVAADGTAIKPFQAILAKIMMSGELLKTNYPFLINGTTTGWATRVRRDILLAYVCRSQHVIGHIRC